jgi:hypothetical protein
MAMLAASAHADNFSTVNGSIWGNQAAAAANPTIANVPTIPYDVRFITYSPLNLASGGLYTIGEFLSSNGIFNVFTGISHLGDTLNNTIFDFQGTVSVTNGQTITVGHDDGLTLVIGGLTVISAPGSTGLVNVTYTGPTGNLPFELVYGVCCGAPANLAINLPLFSPGIPEPETYALMLAGLGLLGFVARRRKQKAGGFESRLHNPAPAGFLFSHWKKTSAGLVADRALKSAHVNGARINAIAQKSALNSRCARHCSVSLFGGSQHGRT